MAIRTPYSTSGVRAPDPPERPDGADDGANHQPSAQESRQTIAIETADAAPQDAPAFLRRGFGSKAQGPGGQSSQLSNPLTYTATKMHSIVERWRRHFAQDTSMPKAEHHVAGIGGALHLQS